MPSRPTPPGADLNHALLANTRAEAEVIDFDDALRIIAGTFRTTHKTAARWVRERRDEGTLGWYSLRVEGSSHYVIKVTGPGAPDREPSAMIYVRPGTPMKPAAYADRSLLTDREARVHRQGPDRLYLTPVEVYDRIHAAAVEARDTQRAAAEAMYEASQHLAEPLRAVLRKAGLPETAVSLNALRDEPLSLMLVLQPDQIEAFNAALHITPHEELR